MNHEEILLEPLIIRSDNSRINDFDQYLEVFKFFQKKKYDFSTAQFIYEKLNPLCKSYFLGLNYYSRINDVLNVGCFKVYCPRCRNKIKMKMKKAIEFNVLAYDVNFHYVITTAGKSYRKVHDWIDSYNDMLKAWNKILQRFKIIASNLKKNFYFICFMRSQKSGYCHLHILCNVFVSESYLEKMLEDYYGVGNQLSVEYHSDVENYLSNDFLKDNEWIIPYGKRHFSCSEEIDLNIYEDFNKYEDLHIILDRAESIVDQVAEQIEGFNGYHLPLPFFLKYFVELNNK